MAGHSKWANIQHRKGAQDKKRGKLFTKLIRNITVAARAGNDLEGNAALRLAVDKARAQSLPKDKIASAIKRGSGNMDGVDYEEITYEGYGPGGVAVMVECMTDNRNRTVADVRHAFSKSGGNLGADGSVAYIFTKTGLFSFPASTDEDRLMEAAIEAGAEDVVIDTDGSIDVLTAPADFEAVQAALQDADLKAEIAEITMRPSVSSELDSNAASSMVKLLEMLEDLDDVQSVHSNAEIPDEILASL
ncbi:MAG: YebC/PmpR family DNA-binding transcriptional regulator [Chromatiales bacterium]|jgi:YebC/PmpR family DNA-binding regulatory protein|nr:YebC/PmpR family DNA-binding transcriptional regulator [Chromatiales bacterium]MDP6150837.1 YebC/PmpR family DNA-binding transcriptional regulator [Gammaproteobacteria bacterium]MDP7093322.1 YebC/PmpR family DNA-binding transcriptional regulator [Gammaproteobacteria bacterium]MDP7271784.1 YebC/PmpR family DNA-binding transcriptional regulator [Gammaproteobacteria bacterium]HJP05455.1 YebC/PmpR family DNA-binding transcriptional regulator [Gammaproteobacteria bacterium]